MQCPSCGKTDRVTIGNRQYCASCGAVVSDDAGGGQVATSGARPVAMMDIRPPSASVAATEPLPPTPEPVVPETSESVEPEPAQIPATVAPVTINPSNQFHKPPTGSDRSVEPTQKAVTVIDAVIKPSVAITPQPAPATSAPAAAIDASRQSARLAKASDVPKSSAINKFVTPAVAAPPEEPKSQPAPAAEPVLATPIPPVASTPTPTPTVALPNAAATQVDNLQKLVPPAEAPANLAATLKPSSVAITAVALAVMAGWIWAANYPAMTLKLASAKAGIEASLPSYVPPSFALAGPVSYSPGQVTIHFNSANGDALTLSQAKTNWDPRSLLENFVNQKTDKYLAVQDQGLTVYLYNGNQASWINKGIWYTIEGNNQLNREQILKIVNSL